MSNGNAFAILQDQSPHYSVDNQFTDRIYDANGNPRHDQAGNRFAFDAQNQLTARNDGAEQMVYDGDGNLVGLKVNGVTTRYVVDDGLNPTGYSQIIAETVGAESVAQYYYGLDLIAQERSGQRSYYGYDGHGSVRQLTDAAGNITDS